MNRIREHLSAWLVVGLLALGLVAVWDAGGGSTSGTLACADGATSTAGVNLPRGTTAWAPDPALAGLPRSAMDRAGMDMTVYEVAEARSLARHGVATQPAFVAHNSAPPASATC